MDSSHNNLNSVIIYSPFQEHKRRYILKKNDFICTMKVNGAAVVFKISNFVFCRRKNCIQVWKEMAVVCRTNISLLDQKKSF